jgi:hypothetical protein
MERAHPAATGSLKDPLLLQLGGRPRNLAATGIGNILKLTKSDLKEKGAACTDANRLLSPPKRHLPSKSTTKLKCPKKSAPKMGKRMSDSRKIHWNC